ncbi:hypothetical protein DFQ28_010497 [Apophysomyces sp. BC1034]|nr:hypothetical protein DFQ28_010497 [Apophysomyces sp. BC1034]
MPVRPSPPAPRAHSRAALPDAADALLRRVAPPRPDEPTELLGGLTPAQFMQRYWQKKPLLVRQALSNTHSPITRECLFDLAQRDDIESRMIRRRAMRGDVRWHLEHGPFERLPAARQRQWTLLVQGVNLHEPAADALMSRFRFLPDARLDDVMISYATDGGGVGPHVDSYDVFLLQLEGKRRWRIGAQRDLSLKPGLPLKILQHFKPTEDWILEPGDMLYLPPHIAHDGIAQGECMTCSIGFRAPLEGELLGQFLYHASERTAHARGAQRRYADPWQRPVGDHPAALPRELVGHVADLVERMHWSRADIAEFVGSYLSEPKSSVFFNPPARTLSHNAFASRIAKNGIELDPKTILLYDDARYYLNGESATLVRSCRTMVTMLADQRAVPGEKFALLAADILRYEILSVKDNELAPDLSTVDMKVHIIPAQAVGERDAMSMRATSGHRWVLKHTIPDVIMKKSLLVASLLAVMALAACGKKEESTAPSAASDAAAASASAAASDAAAAASDAASAAAASDAASAAAPASDASQ